MRIATIAAAELRRRVRSRSALITAFVGPLALAVVFSVLVGGADQAGFTVGIVDADRSALTTSLVEGLAEGLTAADQGDQAEDAGAVAIEVLTDGDEATGAVDEGDLDAAIVLPEGFEAAVTSGRAATITVLRSPERAIGGLVAEAVAGSIAGRLRQVDLAVRTVATLQGAPPTAEVLQAAADQPARVSLTDLPAGEREVSAAAFYGASMSILFLFFTAGYAARSVLEEQRLGTLARMLTTPTSAGEVIAGKAIAVGLLAVVGFLTVWVVTTVAFGAEWGPPAGVLAVIVATVVAVTGVAVLIAGFARTQQQAEAWTAATTFALALLGGNFVGPNPPALLRPLTRLTPNGWALAAFTDLSAGNAGLAGVLPAVGVLVVIGVVTGAIGLGRIHGAVAP